MKKIVASLLLILTTNSWASMQPGTEPLMGAQVFGNSVKIQVRTGGCTWKDSFIVKKSLNVRRNVAELTFVRIVPDNCEAFIPQGRVFTFSLSELRVRSLEGFVIANPFLPR